MIYIAVTSGKGGTGKSCVAAYTALAFAKAGFNTLLVELGADFRSLDVIVAATDNLVFDICDALADRCPAQKAIISSNLHPKLCLLPSGLYPSKDLTQENFDNLLKSFSGYDYIVFDGIDFSKISPRFADMVLQVLTPDTLAIRACQQQAQDLFAAGVKELRLVLNNVPPQILPMYGVKDFDDIINTVGAQLIAVIPQSPKLQFSSNNSHDLIENSLTIKVFDNLAARIQGKRRELLVQ